MTDFYELITDSLRKEAGCPVYYLDPPDEMAESPYIRVADPDITDSPLKGGISGRGFMMIHVWFDDVSKQTECLALMNKAITICDKALDDKNAILYRVKKSINYDVSSSTMWLHGAISIYFKY